MVGTFPVGNRGEPNRRSLWSRSGYNEKKKVAEKCDFYRHLSVNRNQEYLRKVEKRMLVKRILIHNAV